MDLSIHRVLNYLNHCRNQRIRLAPEFCAPLFELLSLLTPEQAAGTRKIRIGAARDGGYVMLDDFKKLDLALSLGIGPDVSWDYEIAEKGIPVWQYDHTISVLPKEHPLFRFEKKRLVSQSSSANDLSMTTLLHELAEKQFVLKMDIEGGEWEILAQIPPHLLSNCRQIVIEFHDFRFIEKTAWRHLALQALILLVKDFGVVHVHGNNLSKHIITDHFKLPDSLEVTFANRHFYELEPTEETFPGPFDKKNNPYFSDFNLGRFRFQQHPEKT